MCKRLRSIERVLRVGATKYAESGIQAQLDHVVSDYWRLITYYY